MRVPRLYTSEDLSAPLLTLDPDAGRRLRRVLRLRPGALVRLFDGQGQEAEGTLQADGSIAIERRWREEESGPKVHIFPAQIRANRFDWLVEKAVEIGATSIRPVVCERSLADETGGRVERWRRLAVEAAEQSGRALLPAVRSPLPFAGALTAAQGEIVLAFEGERELTLARHLRSLEKGSELSLFTGPEGGYSEAEVDAAQTAGATLVSLGPFTLRAETAAIVALAVATQALA